jgi:hypothetical protein
MSRCRCFRAPWCYKAYVWCEPGPERTRTGMSAAEGADIEALSKGRAIPGHLGACAVVECSHHILWHDRPSGTSARPGAACLIPGCPCPGLARHEITVYTLTRQDPVS